MTLRRQGASLREIETVTNVSKSTLSRWLRDIELSPKAIAILLEKKENTKENLKKGIYYHKVYKEKVKQRNDDSVAEVLASIKLNKSMIKLACALLYWAEGGKHYGVRFTNSDPKMIATFLHLLRSGFNIDEKRLKLLVHIHEYHDERLVKLFWSQVTHIPIEQFNKSYLKPHTAIRQKDGYMGCAHVYYSDWTVVHELMTLYNAFARSIGT